MDTLEQDGTGTALEGGHIMKVLMSGRGPRCEMERLGEF